MNITLTTTWNPRGEDERLVNLLPLLKSFYQDIVVVYRPGSDLHLQKSLEEAKVITLLSPEWSWGRYLALKAALETKADLIHYADMDRLLRWVETRPEEWKLAVMFAQSRDCVVFGRTDAAYRTHPQAMIQTEKISNSIASYLIGRQMDVSAGSKAFSRRATSSLIEHTRPRRAIGMDAEWLVLLKRAGFAIDYMEVDGLDYETADRYQSQAATIVQQAEHSLQVDTDPQQWALRVSIALEIVQSAIEAQKLILTEEPRVKSETLPVYDSSTVEFDFDAVFDVDDHMYYYADSLTDERTEAEVNSIINLLQLSEPTSILDLACGYGRHTNRLAALGHHMTGVDFMPGFLDLARRDARERNVCVNYVQNDMRKIEYHEEFDVVLILFTAFGYFNDEENIGVMQNVYNALKPGGRVLFDIPNRDTFLKNMPPCIVTEKDGNLMIDRGSFDSLTGHWINRRIMIRDGIRKDKPFKIRMFNPNEINELLKQAGLQLDQIYGGWDGQPISPETRRMIIIGRKPGN